MIQSSTARYTGFPSFHEMARIPAHKPSSAPLGGVAASQLRDLNLDLFAFVARCLALGDTGSLLRIGLSPTDLPHLRNLSLSQLMALSERGADLHGYLKKI